MVLPAVPDLLSSVILVVPFKPLADAVGDYTSSDGHQESDNEIHTLTPFLLPVC